MASSLRGKKYKFVTPFGRASFPYLHAPDTKFATEDRPAKYKVDLILEPQDAKPFLTEAKKVIQRVLDSGEASASPKMPGEKLEDGKYKISFKTLHKPALFDAEGKPLADGLKVGGGTVLRIAGKMQAYEGFGHTGVTFYMNGVQIKELHTFSADADSFGFDAVEGFSGDDIDDDDMFSDDDDSLDSDPLDGDSDWDEDF